MQIGSKNAQLSGRNLNNSSESKLALSCVLSQFPEPELADSYSMISRSCRQLAAPVLIQSGRLIADYQTVAPRVARLPVVPSFCSQRLAMNASTEDIDLLNIEWLCPKLYEPNLLSVKALSPECTAQLLSHLLAQSVGLGLEAADYYSPATPGAASKRFLIIEAQVPITEIVLPFKAPATGETAAERSWATCQVKSLPSEISLAMGLDVCSAGFRGVVCYEQIVGSDYSSTDESLQRLYRAVCPSDG